MTIRIKESTKPLYKISAIKQGWLERALSRRDLYGRTGAKVFEEHNIEVVHGKEKADIGFAMHGDPVHGVPRRKCVMLKGEPPIYNIFYGWRLCHPRFLKKFMGVLSVYEMEGLDQTHYNSPQFFYKGDDKKSYIERFFDQPKTEFLTMILMNKKHSATLNNLFPGLRKYNKQTNHFIRASSDEQFCKLLGPEKYHSYGRGKPWCAPCFKGPIRSDSVTKASYDPLYETLSKYKFNFCPENSRFNGYITEKPIQAMFCGSVPIYLGAPDVYDYLPFGTFIDIRYKTPKQLVEYLLEMPEKEYQGYRKAIKKFITSPKVNMYSSHVFANKIVSIIEGNK